MPEPRTTRLLDRQHRTAPAEIGSSVWARVTAEAATLGPTSADWVYAIGTAQSLKG
jgi:hypothetical protein